MNEFLVFLANIPGLILFLLLCGGLMIGLELKKLSNIAIKGKLSPGFSFPLLFPGVGLFTFGILLISL
ncbi:MAG: hypothetical protein QNL04_08915 [SAR324 cluster bacterium]|nr:hypothetical protein [SAR324 cluster bacterium]